ncbi:molybdopterin-dependent oxidoreductase [Shimia sagamensis]|uniref:Xanthine dehydrogenase, molybdenum binding subunit apoprotein n=1 Tax=Shimia sagamensis TaxID=1566352 RepID=A0ABY1NIV5_9RHOB|nr:molybdopterin cofactor-binding domain-containing protein [Shimia sagamensis]SMP10153.1 xanthine dehydrogenase, molybdenum binding subunit apoprotein [Shimia sagamensis]
MISFEVNGEPQSIDVPMGRRLSDVLRDNLQLRGTKVGCDAGDCGACTVLVDGKATCACLTPVAQISGRSVETIEGVGRAGPNALQRAFLRHGAAQCGICTPGMVMAAEALIRQNVSPDRAAVEAALSGVLCRCTGYTKIIDAVLDAAGSGAGPEPDAGKAVGARVERLDGAAKVMGTEAFGADIVPDGALWVRALRSPHAAAGFAFGDIEGWAKTHDVRVFTAKNIPGENCFGVIERFSDQPVLAEAEVRMVGEAVALVAGGKDVVSNLDLGSFPVCWEPSYSFETATEARDESARQLHLDRAGNQLIAGVVRRGDAEASLGNAAHVVQGTLRTGHVEHAYIEPEAGLAWMDGGVLNIRACTQAPVLDQQTTAKVLGLPTQKVRIRPAATGGGFGAKLDVTVQPLVGLVTLLTGRPSAMVYSRGESMMASTKRHPAEMQARIGADIDGRLVGMTFDGDFDTGAYASWGPTVAVRVPVHASGPYIVPNYEAEARAIHTNGPVSGAFRGFGVPQAAALQEQLLDQLADQVGMDSLAFRRLNALSDGVPTVCGQELSGVGIGACLDALQSRWDAALIAVAGFNAATKEKARGIGVASCWYGCGNTALPNPSTMRIGITADGKICLHQGAMDIGQGANTVIAQLAADALGVPVHHVTLIDADTAVTPDCGKTSASRQTVVSGKAAVLAAEALRSKALQLANVGPHSQMSLSGAVLTLIDGTVRRDVSLQELPEDAHGYVLWAEARYDPPTEALDKDGQGAPYAVYGYGAQLAEVEVDLALGTVQVLKVTAAHDVGKVINPLLAEGQIEGGIAQGLGMALMEEFHPGITENLHDYLIPTIGDVPEVVSHLIEVPDPEGPMGAKGLGEHVLIPTAPAILNAIRHATGAVLTQLPARPDRVLAALKAAKP